MELIPEHGKCFVCGSDNPYGLGIRWWEREDGHIVAEVSLTAAHQGPPGFVHGGVSAAIMDEAMGAAVWRAGFRVATVNLQIEYRRPVAIGQPFQIEAYVRDHAGGTVWARGEIRLADGRMAVIGRGIFVEAPHLFADRNLFVDEWGDPDSVPGPN